MMNATYDVIIIGGGPAGLSAALVLGRCRRRVLVLDSNQPRNGASRALHGYLTRDGVSPHDLRRLGREELAAYDTVEFRDTAAMHVSRDGDGFLVVTKDCANLRCRLLLLATGRLDPLPSKPGFREFYGRGVYHCPYCDGWEHRDQAIVVYGNGEWAVGMAAELLTWSAQLTIVTDGPSTWPAAGAKTLERNRIGVRSAVVQALTGDNRLQGIRFTDGNFLPCEALFFLSKCIQRSSLPEMLGCEFDDEFSVICEANAAKGVRGLYVAGNVRGGLHFAIAAAAEGADAAIAINRALLGE